MQRYTLIWNCWQYFLKRDPVDKPRGDDYVIPRGDDYGDVIPRNDAVSLCDVIPRLDRGIS